MWHTWLQSPPRPGRPECWWSQLEREARTGLPFAHLFPRPPTSRGPAPSETQRLVQAIRREGTPARSGLAEAVLGAAAPRPTPPPQPREAAPAPAWGPDSALVQAWFAQGEAEAQAAVAEAEALPEPRGLQRLWAWCRRRFQRPEPYTWAGAEL